jgi:hypothetical protein
VRSCRTVLIFVVGLVAYVALGSVLVEPVAVARTAPVRVQVILENHKTLAGSPINAIVILTNTASIPITVHACSADHWLQVGLKGDRFAYQPLPSPVICATRVQLHPGPNRFDTTVVTTYQRCIAGGQPTASTPTCEGTMTVPPLPAGRYVTSVFIAGLSHLTTAAATQAVSLIRG